MFSINSRNTQIIGVLVLCIGLLLFLLEGLPIELEVALIFSGALLFFIYLYKSVRLSSKEKKRFEEIEKRGKDELIHKQPWEKQG